MVTKKQKELADKKLEDVIRNYEQISTTPLQKKVVVLYKWAKLNNNRPARLRLDESKKKFQIPRCIECGKMLNPIASEQYQFIGYRCEEHTDFYLTSIFMNAVISVYSDVLK